jgi:hypothetical protein
MTKSEAIKAMKSGKKVTHNYFGSKEWITMKGNETIITEEGYSFPSHKFWKDRGSKEWETGWSILTA